jgi:hypothetical protein
VQFRNGVARGAEIVSEPQVMPKKLGDSRLLSVLKLAAHSAINVLEAKDLGGSRQDR